MRIASLVPAGTEIAWALGLSDQLVAVTHDCDFPPAVRSLPQLTSSTIPPGATSREIDQLVRSAGEREESTFHIKGEVIQQARPDVILGQTICRVCAVTLEQLPEGIPTAPRVVPLDGADLEGVLADIRRVSEALDLADRGRQVELRLRARLEAVAARVADVRRPAVAFLEWLDPPFNGGHWVPDQIRIAGGRDVLGRAGERSRVVTWDEVARAEPDVLVAALCGFGVERAAQDLALAATSPDWARIPAARGGRVYAANGSAYFSRPGPRLVDGVEILAAILHPDAFPPSAPADAMSVPLAGVVSA